VDYRAPLRAVKGKDFVLPKATLDRPLRSLKDKFKKGLKKNITNKNHHEFSLKVLHLILQFRVKIFFINS